MYCYYNSIRCFRFPQPYCCCMHVCVCVVSAVVGWHVVCPRPPRSTQHSWCSRLILSLDSQYNEVITLKGEENSWRWKNSNIWNFSVWSLFCCCNC